MARKLRISILDAEAELFQLAVLIAHTSSVKKKNVLTSRRSRLAKHVRELNALCKIAVLESKIVELESQVRLLKGQGWVKNSGVTHHEDEPDVVDDEEDSMQDSNGKRGRYVFAPPPYNRDDDVDSGLQYAFPSHKELVFG